MKEKSADTSSLKPSTSLSTPSDISGCATTDVELAPALPLDLSGLQGLSLHEQKCVLVNRELDAQGMGRYQWYVWGLCGFGYFLDLMWAQAFSLCLSPLQQELGFSNSQSGRISTCFNAGLTAGALFWGFMSDIVGRRWAFNLTCLLSSIFGLVLGLSNSYTTFLVLTAFVGFGVGGNIPVDGAIFLEFVPQSRRFLLACLSVFQPLGVVACSSLAFAFIPSHSCTPNFSQHDALPSCRNSAAPCCARSNNMGWRYLLFTLGGITLFVFAARFLVFTCRETPKFLIYQGQDQRAIETMRHVSHVNGNHCRLSLQVFEALDREHQRLSDSASDDDQGRKPPGVLVVSKPKWRLSQQLNRYKMLFSSWQMSRLTLLTWLTYILDFSGFTVAGFYLPRILALKNGGAHVSLKFTYASYIYTYAPGIVGVLVGAWTCRIPRIGRKWTMVLASGLMGTSIFLLSQVDTVAKREGLFTLEYFFQSMFNAVLYGWTPEAFPAPVRGTACGMASFWGRLFGIVSPLIAQHLYGRSSSGNGDINSVLYLAGGVTLGCVISTALLPTAMMETQDERSQKAQVDAT
ncbi:hypothetical protein CDD81_5350 [Ophiocordyceps australis]|uniref:Major facilitator superfamily (MFS) profile domain-containing protein n=1 Tax=Ophiocordyceps australis TaxID=1399860 RepID=A0A2C5Y9I8_9HYPO|nr:hypothetical protein CDD81_5350 [Ophiocordyceps australis]